MNIKDNIPNYNIYSAITGNEEEHKLITSSTRYEEVSNNYDYYMEKEILESGNMKMN